MFDTIQEVIDRLAATLGRSVILVDAEFVLLASTRHYDDLDAAQIQMVTSRRAIPALADSLRTSRGVTVLDPAPDSGLDFPRLTVALTSQVETLGYALVTQPTPLGPAEFEQVVDVSDVLRRLMESMSRSIADVNLAVEGELMALLTDEPASRERAASELRDMGMFTQSRQFVALCLATDSEWTPWDGPSVREVITRVLARAITTPRINAYAFVPTAPESFVLIGFHEPPSQDALQSIVQGLVVQLSKAWEGAELPGRVGVGGTVDALADAWLSYDQAVVAARVARAAVSPFAYWQDAPIAASLAALFGPVVPPHLRTDPLRKLEAAPDDVVALLESYFEESGSASAMAQQLGVHRSTIYQRLERAAEIVGLDLARGDDRLVIHAWLTRRRFAD